MNIQSVAMINSNAHIGKSDICFRRAYDKVKRNYIILLLVHVFKTILLIIYIPINYTIINAKPNLITAAMALALFISFLSFSYYLLSICKMFTGVRKFLQAAYSTGHTGTQNIDNYNSMDAVTSSTLLIASQSQINVADIPEVGVNVYVNATVGDVYRYNSRKHSCLDSMENIVTFFTLGVMVLVIIAVSSERNANVGETIILVVYIVLEAISKPKVMLVVILIALSPLLCLCFCLFVCICHKPNGQYLAIKQKQATLQDIITCGGQCSICLQGFMNKDKVYILPCSNMHMFHSGCLNNWMRVRTNCPSCRAEIPMTNVNDVIVVAGGV